MATGSRRRLVSFGGASLAALLALAIGFGGGWLARKETTSTTTTSTTTTTSSSTTSTTAVARLSACGGNDLSGTVTSSPGGAAGTVSATITVSNVSSTGCTLHGYPELQLLSPNSEEMTTTTVDGGEGFPVAAANAAPRTVRLSVGHQATFLIQFSQTPTGTQTTCPEAASINVYPPGSTVNFNVAYELTPCDLGTIDVSPFFVTS
jgi:hypothetical protein